MVGKYLFFSVIICPVLRNLFGSNIELIEFILGDG
jgi:hypothetical protein